jgi:hypothetical protein
VLLHAPNLPCVCRSCLEPTLTTTSPAATRTRFNVGEACPLPSPSRFDVLPCICYFLACAPHLGEPYGEDRITFCSPASCSRPRHATCCVQATAARACSAIVCGPVPPVRGPVRSRLAACEASPRLPHWPSQVAGRATLVSGHRGQIWSKAWDSNLILFQFQFQFKSVSNF